MGKTEKPYSRAFKLKVVQTVETGELRPLQACREYQIAESVLTRWRREVRLRGAEAAFTPLADPNATPDYEAQIAELERVCGHLAVEHAAVQKAVQRLQSTPGTSACAACSRSSPACPYVSSGDCWA